MTRGTRDKVHPRPALKVAHLAAGGRQNLNKKAHHFMQNEREVKARQRWMGILARAPFESIETAWGELSQRPIYTFLRKPETGTVMVRARTEGEGRAFNFGEVPVTRCAVRTQSGLSGCAYVKGTRLRHAELAAVFDALLQDDEARGEVLDRVIEPLAEKLAVEKRRSSKKTETTRVDFFTMVRGE